MLPAFLINSPSPFWTECYSLTFLPRFQRSVLLQRGLFSCRFFPPRKMPRVSRSAGCLFKGLSLSALQINLWTAFPPGFSPSDFPLPQTFAFFPAGFHCWIPPLLRGGFAVGRGRFCQQTSRSSVASCLTSVYRRLSCRFVRAAGPLFPFFLLPA